MTEEIKMKEMMPPETITKYTVMHYAPTININLDKLKSEDKALVMALIQESIEAINKIMLMAKDYK